ncbi:hypothetical protein O3Q52_23000 [Streptomyces sp. ActVer]|uniref:hypothetical protein n=1 Tax=Streptomyces sp. ActVer TaxID=3014558 RepID=UPI0022B2C9F6|nr:hypothetical protein [Streptomyces sp. ActVer]MCZ4511006.1 hypothetical protein [Streptomyces sp. ActVer]
MKLTKARAACVTLCAFGLGFVTANSASAASFSYGAYEGGGWGYWQEDPGPDPMGYGDAPGDSIGACDMKADGWGIEVRLDIGRDGDIDRKVSTRGQDSPYCSDWKSGDIKEGTPVRVWVVKVRGTTDYHPVYKDGNA